MLRYMQPAPRSVHSSPGGSAKQVGVPLQWQHDAAEPHVAGPQTLPGSSWQVPLMTHVY
jgi:hypothetical protein